MLEKIHSLPAATRMRILWASVAVLAIGVFVLWLTSTSQNVRGILGEDNSAEEETPTLTATTSSEYIKIEWAERKDGKLKIFFKAANNTGGILNFSATENIKLTAGGKTLNPEQILDRQGGPYVKRLLSKSENSGILVFADAPGNSAELIFDQLYFESTDATVFNQMLQLDLKALNKPLKFRS